MHLKTNLCLGVVPPPPARGVTDLDGPRPPPPTDVELADGWKDSLTKLVNTLVSTIQTDRDGRDRQTPTPVQPKSLKVHHMV